MARHRNYRNYAYEDDMSDDVYGHSVEDYDMAVSPSTAEEFMFRRSNSRDPNLSVYMADRFGRVDEEDEEESEEEPLTSSLDYRRPQLDPTSQVKLSSCLDQLHSILGESLHEPTAVTAVIQNNFDTERALDQILSQGGKQDLKANLHQAGVEGSVSYQQTHSLTKVTPYGQNSQCEKEVSGQSSCIENLNLKLTETVISFGNKSSVMGLSASISDTSPSTTLVQGISAVDFSNSLVADNASLSKPQHTVPLLSLDPKTNLDTNPVLPAPLDSQPISSGHLTMAMDSENPHLSLPCISQTVGLQWEQSRTSVPLEPSQTIFQNSLLSVPLSSLSQSGGLVSGSPATSLPATPLQASSQHSLFSVPLSSLSGQVGAPSLSEPLKSAPQNPPLSLNSLSQLSYKQVLLPSEPSHTMSESPLLSVPLSSLSQYSGLSFGKPPLESLLQTTSPSPFLSIPGSTLLETPTSVSVSHPSCYQDHLLSAPLCSLSQSGCFPPGHPAALLSSTLGCSPTVSQTFKAVESLSSLSKAPEMPVVEVHVKTHESGTADVKSLGQGLQNVGMVGNAANISPEEKDFNHNHKAEHKNLLPVATPVEHTLNIYNKGYQKKRMHQERQLNRTCNDTYPLNGKPTMFALALCCSTCASAKTLSANKTVVQRVVKELYNLDCLSVVPFHFSSLSPDDIVNERQKGAFSGKK